MQDEMPRQRSYPDWLNAFAADCSKDLNHDIISIDLEMTRKSEKNLRAVDKQSRFVQSHWLKPEMLA